MLVLTRRSGEEIVIGNDIRIVVNRITGNRVTIGITAPQEIRVVRGELERFTTEFEDIPQSTKNTSSVTNEFEFDPSDPRQLSSHGPR